MMSAVGNTSYSQSLSASSSATSSQNTNFPYDQSIDVHEVDEIYLQIAKADKIRDYFDRWLALQTCAQKLIVLGDIDQGIEVILKKVPFEEVSLAFYNIVVHLWEEENQRDKAKKIASKMESLGLGDYQHAYDFIEMQSNPSAWIAKQRQEALRLRALWHFESPGL